MIDRLKNILSRYDEIEELMNQPEAMSDMKKFFPNSKIIQEKSLGCVKSIISLNNLKL